MDYRQLNGETWVAETWIDAYPMPQVDDIMDQEGQAKYISTLYLEKEYWQVPVATKNCPKPAFIIPKGLY